MYLVDTSVWIDFLRGNPTSAVELLRRLLGEGASVGITSMIYQEILQGAESEVRFQQFANYFSSQRFYHPRDPIRSYAEAAQLYFRCRRAGFTLRSTIDCLIAQIALEHDLYLLHSDRDFQQMATVIPVLKAIDGN